MANLNSQGNITASCPGCDGATSTFEWMAGGVELGKTHQQHAGNIYIQYRLFRCAGCGAGAIGYVYTSEPTRYPRGITSLQYFNPESKLRLKLPDSVPAGIKAEFNEAESCLEHNNIRAAAGMFRSVLDKTLRANGYKVKKGTTLDQQIDAAAKDGAITESRRRRAHDEIRVLGNDVLHDEWHEIPEEDVMAARHYTQRVLEDFYDDRDTVLAMLREAKRTPDEDKEAAASDTEE